MSLPSSKTFKGIPLSAHPPHSLYNGHINLPFLPYLFHLGASVLLFYLECSTYTHTHTHTHTHTPLISSHYTHILCFAHLQLSLSLGVTSSKRLPLIPNISDSSVLYSLKFPIFYLPRMGLLVYYLALLLDCKLPEQGWFCFALPCISQYQASLPTY